MDGGKIVVNIERRMSCSVIIHDIKDWPKKRDLLMVYAEVRECVFCGRAYTHIEWDVIEYILSIVQFYLGRFLFCDL